MEGTESADRSCFHVVRIDLALHQIHPIAGAADHEVDFVVRLVAPVEDPLVPEPDAQGVQNEMLPQQSAVVVADTLPTLLEGDEAGVEGVALGTPDDPGGWPSKYSSGS